MCPVCLATAAWIAAAAVSTGGIGALAIKNLVTRKTASITETAPSTKEDRHG
jgi:hypothetical protein